MTVDDPSSAAETFSSSSGSADLENESEAPDAFSATASSALPDESAKAPRLTSRMRPTMVVLLLGLLLAAAGAAIGWWVREVQESDLAPLTVEATLDRPVVLRMPSNAVPDRIPGVLGLVLDDAQRVLFGAGVPTDVITVNTRTSALEEGLIIFQEPSAGSVFRGSVMLVVSTEAFVPELIGLPLDEARALLEDLGSRPILQRLSGSGVEPGIVVGVSPPPGARLERSVLLQVSSQ